MVGLVEHDKVVKPGPHLLPQASVGEHADRAEQVFEPVGLVRTDLQCTEILVSQHGAKGHQGLLEDFLAVGHEQQAGLPPLLFVKSLKVKGGNDRLTGAGRGDHQVAPLAMDGPLPLECIEDAFLKGVGPQIEKERRPGALFVSCPRNGTAEQFRAGRVKGHELPAVPVSLEFHGKLFQDVRHILGRDLEIPFQAAGDGGVGDVGGTDVGRGKTAVAPEMVRLGV